MKLLVATRRTQGQRENDFCHTIDGELVQFAFTCSRDEEDPDGGCGCGRAWAGLNSGKSTTTAEVREVDFTYADLFEAIRSSLEQAGWSPEDAKEHTDELVDLVTDWPVGTIVERRLDEVRVRA